MVLPLYVAIFVRTIVLVALFGVALLLKQEMDLSLFVFQIKCQKTREENGKKADDIVFADTFHLSHINNKPAKGIKETVSCKTSLGLNPSAVILSVKTFKNRETRFFHNM